jgi:hypothetical protein
MLLQKTPKQPNEKQLQSSAAPHLQKAEADIRLRGEGGLVKLQLPKK